MIRLALLVDSPSRRAHGNAATRLALGLAETGGFESTLVCYGDDPAPPWLPPEVRVHRLGTGRVTRSLPGIVHYLRTEQPDVLITRQVHANFVGLAASWLARIPATQRQGTRRSATISPPSTRLHHRQQSACSKTSSTPPSRRFATP